MIGVEYLVTFESVSTWRQFVSSDSQPSILFPCRNDLTKVTTINDPFERTSQRR